jgi:hypothetical protein
LRPWWHAGEPPARFPTAIRTLGGLAPRRAGHSRSQRDNLHPTGTEYFVIPGGPIPRDVGDELITMPDIRPLDRSLFPDNGGQTWELVR